MGWKYFNYYNHCVTISTCGMTLCSRDFIIIIIIIITQVLLATQLSWIDITIGYN